jgi:hypothetical protein
MIGQREWQFGELVSTALNKSLLKESKYKTYKKSSLHFQIPEICDLINTNMVDYVIMLIVGY